MSLCENKLNNKLVLSFVVIFQCCLYTPSSACIIPSSPKQHAIPLVPHLCPITLTHSYPFQLEDKLPNLEQKTMAIAFTNAEMKASLLQIINERNQLKVELIHANSAIIELENQNQEYDRLLSNALSQLQACKPKPIVTVSPKTSWIGTWQCSSDYPQLAPIEKSWANGWLQKALAQMPAVLDQDLGAHHTINSRLLYSALLQSTGANLRQALANAEEAVAMAVDLGLQELAAKGQFHRALCYHYLGEFANARWCFVLASSVDETTKDFRQLAQENLRKLPKGHSQRSVSADFKFYCNSKADDFVRGV